MRIKTLAYSLMFIAVTFTAAWLLFSQAQSSDNQATPGSADDPLITKSYADEQIKTQMSAEVNKMKTAFQDMMEEQLEQAQLNALNEFQLELNKMKESELKANEMRVVTIKPNQRLIAKGGTEVVVRVGRAVVFSPNENGVSNITSGKDLDKGALIPNDSLILFPRDGRGLQHVPNAKTDLIVLVRGAYDLTVLPAGK